MSMIVEFVCWHCRAPKKVEIPHEPQFAFEIAGWANDAGMYGAMDMRYGRALIFCNEEHANNEKTKAGYFRMYPKGPAKTKEQSHVQ
jgi:hypothetical protein